MKRFKNILLYASSKTDNKTALRYAASLAEKNEATLKVVDVIKEESHYTPILPESIKGINLHDILHEDRHDDLERLVYPYRDKGIDIKIKVLSGTPFINIIWEIVRKEHDLLITTPQGSGGLSEALFGTTTMHLMRKCPCPVWAIKPSKETSFSRIMAAVDFDPAHEENEALNTKIMELAVSLAQSHESELHVVHAWSLPGERKLRNIGSIRQSEVEKIVQKAMETHKEWLEELIQKYSPETPGHHVHLLKGEAGDLISDTAKKNRVDLIVMGTVGRTGIPGFFIGNTAEKILQQVDCSVMAVKPDGFISPIEIE